MNIEIIPVYEYLDKFICETQNKPADVEKLWNKYAIEPYWSKLCEYAPMDLSERKPRAITNIELLKDQVRILRKLNLNEMKLQFQKTVEELPNYDDDLMVIAIYPLGDDNTVVNEKQNGVVGTSLYGNNIISVNPLVKDYEKWLLYVFAHEYHHTVFGNYWFVRSNQQVGNKFITSLLSDGEADSFAMGLNKDLRPKWLFDLSNSQIEELWKKYYKVLSLKEDVNYCKYMFGDDEIPWCAGYAIGYWLAQKYIKQNPEKTFKEIIEIKPEEILGTLADI